MAGSKASEEVALQRSRGRLPALFVSKFERLATAKLVPSYLKVEVDYVDDYLDQQREIIADIRARNLQRMVEAGILTTEAARDRLYRDHYISDTARLTMALQDGLLSDGTPAIRAFFDRAYDDILFADRTFVLGDADPAQVKAQVMENTVAIYNLFSMTTSPAKHARYRVALRALEDLQAMYSTPQKPPKPEPSLPPQGVPEQGGIDEDDEQDEVSTKALRIQPRMHKSRFDMEERRDRFREEILVALTRPGGPDDDELKDMMEAALIAAALLPGDSDELSRESKNAIDNEMVLLSGALAGITARALRGSDMGPTADRMSNRVMSVYWAAVAHAGVNGNAYSWMLGETEEHCEHCAHYASLGLKPASFWKKAADEEGHYPGSPLLACSGVNCQCRFV